MKCTETDYSLLAKMEYVKCSDFQCDTPLFEQVTGMTDGENGDFDTADDWSNMLFKVGTQEVAVQDVVGIQGRYKQVNLAYDMKCETDADYEQLLFLCNNPVCIRMTFFGGEKRLLRCDESTYMCSYSEKDGVQKVQIGMSNGSGIVPIL